MATFEKSVPKSGQTFPQVDGGVATFVATFEKKVTTDVSAGRWGCFGVFWPLLEKFLITN